MHLSSNLKKVRALSQSEELLLKNLDISPVVSHERPFRVVKWTKPTICRVKLNVDGSCLGNPGMTSGGGVVGMIWVDWWQGFLLSLDMVLIMKRN